MRIRWRNFELPSQVRLERESATPQYGRFVVDGTSRECRRCRGHLLANGCSGLRNVTDELDESAATIDFMQLRHDPGRTHGRRYFHELYGSQLNRV